MVTAVTVSKIDNGFQVAMTPGKCGHDFPLIGFRNAAVIKGSSKADSDEAIYYSQDFDSGTNFQVTRVQEASRPVSGMLNLQLGENQVEGMYM